MPLKSLLALLCVISLPAVSGYRGDGLNVTSHGLRDFLLSTYNTASIASLPTDPSRSIDIVLLVENADEGSPHANGGPHQYLLEMLESFLAKPEYAHHRVGLVTFDNKPLPGKGVGAFSNWREPTSLMARRKRLLDAGCPDNAVITQQDSSCYTLQAPLEPLSDSSTSTALLDQVRSILCNPLAGASTNSDSFDALISTVHDSQMGWRQDTPKLIVVFPTRKPENALEPSLKLRWAMDAWQATLTDTKCAEPAIGGVQQALQAYGSAETMPAINSYDDVQLRLLGMCGNWDRRTEIGWQTYYHDPFDIEVKPFDIDALISDPATHCSNNEFPTSYEFYEWVKTLDDSWHVSWILNSYTNLADPLRLKAHENFHADAEQKQLRDTYHSRWIEPSLYGFGDMFLKGRDPVLWQWKTMTRSIQSAEAGLQAFDLFIKWATLL